jgi:hypothetical protein
MVYKYMKSKDKVDVSFKGHPFGERSRSQKMKAAQSQDGDEVGEVVSWDGKPGKGYMFRVSPLENNNQMFGEKESCR